MTKTISVNAKDEPSVSILGRQIARMLLAGNEQSWAELFIERKRGGRVVLTANVTKGD